MSYRQKRYSGPTRAFKPLGRSMRSEYHQIDNAAIIGYLSHHHEQLRLDLVTLDQANTWVGQIIEAEPEMKARLLKIGQKYMDDWKSVGQRIAILQLGSKNVMQHLPPVTSDIDAAVLGGRMYEGGAGIGQALMAENRFKSERYARMLTRPTVGGMQVQVPPAGPTGPAVVAVLKNAAELEVQQIGGIGI